MAKTRVGIIGGGWSGIYTAKHCKEAGLEPTVLEGSEQIGGQWCYRPEKGGGVRDTTMTVSSKIYMSPSDFPYPDDAPEFLPADQVYEHFLNYVEHFNLRDTIQCNQQVIKAQKDTQTNEWVVYTNQGEYRFDKLVIATGMNKMPKVPDDPMYQNFEGKMHHSHDLTILGDKFNGKKVLVIGGSDTASDVACELSEKADVTVSIRHGTWFQDRVVDEISPDLKGHPADMAYSRFIDKVLKTADYNLLKYQGFIRMVEEYWGTCGSGVPEWFTPAGYLNTYYTKSRNLAIKARDGEITPKKGIKAIHGHHVYFFGDPKPHYFDDIIFCTGYQPKLDFEFAVSPTQERFRKVLDVQDPSLAFVGYVRPYLTSIVMLVEMQSRWVADLFSGKMPLPSPDEIQEAIQRDETYRASRFPLYYQRMPFLVDPYYYMDTLAADIGQYPNFLKLIFTHPSLAWHIFMDSWNHYAYRVHDANPAKRSIALEEIEKLKSNPLSTRIRNALYYGVTGLLTNIWSATDYFTNRKPNATNHQSALAEESEPLLEASPKPVIYAYQRDLKQALEDKTPEPHLDTGVALRFMSG